MTLRVWIAFLALCVIWGIPYVFIKIAVLEMSPVWVAWGRIGVGAAVLLPIAWKRGGLRNIKPHLLAIFVFAVVELVGPFYLMALGERWVSSWLAGVLPAAVPLIVVLVAPLFGIHEQLGARRLTGLGVGLAGVVALLGVGTLSGSHEWLGAGCILLAIVGYAIGPLLIQRYLLDVESTGVVAVSLVIGTVLLTVPALFTAPLVIPSTYAIGSVVILGVFCTVIAMLLWIYVISNASASRAVVVTYVNPAVAVALGVWLLNEPFAMSSAIGIALILAGSWLATGGVKNAH